MRLGSLSALCTSVRCRTYIGAEQSYDAGVHELSICQALLTQVTQITRTAGAREVARVVVEVGPLAGVEPGLLNSAFEVMRTGGCASQATLLIESVEIRVSCEICGLVSAAVANRLLCGHCGAYRTRVVCGEELRLLRVELRTVDPSRVLN